MPKSAHCKPPTARDGAARRPQPAEAGQFSQFGIVGREQTVLRVPLLAEQKHIAGNLIARHKPHRLGGQKILHIKLKRRRPSGSGFHASLLAFHLLGIDKPGAKMRGMLHLGHATILQPRRDRAAAAHQPNFPLLRSALAPAHIQTRAIRKDVRGP